MSPLDPSVKLYRETPCEHGYVDGHGPYVGDDLIGCLGGSREEVTIDYEAAARFYSDEVGRRSGSTLTWEAMYEEEQVDFIRVSTGAVDAALKSAGFTKTFTSEKEHQ